MGQETAQRNMSITSCSLQSIAPKSMANPARYETSSAVGIVLSLIGGVVKSFRKRGVKERRTYERGGSITLFSWDGPRVKQDCTFTPCHILFRLHQPHEPPLKLVELLFLQQELIY